MSTETISRKIKVLKKYPTHARLTELLLLLRSKNQVDIDQIVSDIKRDLCIPDLFISKGPVGSKRNKEQDPYQSPEPETTNVQDLLRSSFLNDELCSLLLSNEVSEIKSKKNDVVDLNDIQDDDVDDVAEIPDPVDIENEIEDADQEDKVVEQVVKYESDVNTDAEFSEFSGNSDEEEFSS